MNETKQHRLEIRQSHENSLFYVWTFDPVLDQGIRVSDGFRFDAEAEIFLRGYREGFNASVETLRALMDRLTMRSAR